MYNLGDIPEKVSDQQMKMKAIKHMRYELLGVSGHLTFAPDEINVTHCKKKTD
jgi:hypothetical protein